ncbi:MAG: glutathione S-transferase [Alphaproteobacteria bacterium]|nr:glutathione S-transferase [Alphaproteobacteria bacterium]
MIGTLHDWELDDEAYKVRLGLSLMGLPHARVAVDVLPGREPESLAFRARNPLARLPLWEEPGGITLRDPQAILARLAFRHDPARRFWSDDPAQADWLFFAAREMWAAREARQAALFGGPALHAAAARAALRLLEEHMADRSRDWLLGAMPGIADIALFPAFQLSRDWGCEHEEFPRLRRWARRLRAQPGFTRMPGMPDHG